MPAVSWHIKYLGRDSDGMLYLNVHVRQQHTEITVRSMKMRQHGDYIQRNGCSGLVKLIQDQLLKSRQAPDV